MTHKFMTLAFLWHLTVSILASSLATPEPAFVESAHLNAHSLAEFGFYKETIVKVNHSFHIKSEPCFSFFLPPCESFLSFHTHIPWPNDPFGLASQQPQAGWAKLSKQAHLAGGLGQLLLLAKLSLPSTLRPLFWSDAQPEQVHCDHLPC